MEALRRLQGPEQQAAAQQYYTNESVQGYGAAYLQGRQEEKVAKTHQYFEDKQKNQQTLTKVENHCYIDMPTLKFVEDSTMPGYISLNFDILINNNALQQSNCQVKVYFGFCEH